MATELYREIKINRLKLEKRKPWPDGVKEHLSDWQKEQFVYSSMHLDGYPLSKESIRSISEGELIREASFADYALVQGLSQALEYIESFQAKALTIADKVPRLPEMCRMWGMLEGKSDSETLKAWQEDAFLRTDNPVLHAFNHVPCHFRDVPKRLDAFFQWLLDASQDAMISPVDLAAEAHNRWLHLYPFASHNEATARLLAEAILAANGLPFVPWAMDDTAYNRMVCDFAEQLEQKTEQPESELAVHLEKLVARTQNVALQMIPPQFRTE